MVVANITVAAVTMGKAAFTENNEGQFLLSPVADLMMQQQQQQQKEKMKEKKKKKKKEEKSSCSEGQCKLVDYNSLPNFLKHNEFILDYYRSEWPMKDAIRSIFSIHNETINVWT
ncbi:hypothetical protein BHM03_00040659 [Ensete ventricosum]|nr:hypothetical protein BHM03_00040659 [Ensete ventricosum]